MVFTNLWKSSSAVCLVMGYILGPLFWNGSIGKHDSKMYEYSKLFSGLADYIHRCINWNLIVKKLYQFQFVNISNSVDSNAHLTFTIQKGHNASVALLDIKSFRSGGK